MILLHTPGMRIHLPTTSDHFAPNPMERFMKIPRILLRNLLMFFQMLLCLSFFVKRFFMIFNAFVNK